MSYLERVAKTVSVALVLGSLVAAIVVCLVLATDAVMLSFLAILFAVFLVRATKFLANYIPIGYGGNLTILLAALLGITAGSFYYFGAAIEEQLQASSKKIDESSDELRDWLKDRPVTRNALERIPFAGSVLKLEAEGEPAKAKNEKSDKDSSEDKDSSAGNNSSEDKDREVKSSGDSREGSGETTSTATSSQSSPQVPGLGSMLQGASSVSGKVMPAVGKLFKTSFGLVMNVAFVFFVAVFLAVDPKLYRNGLTRLFPQSRRPKVERLLDKTGETLFAWLTGRLMTMAITGVGTGIGLWLLGVPMAGTVGAITALLTFIPNIGGVLALVLAMLLALSQGPSTVLWVVVMYGGLQLIESNVLTPLIQQQKTSIPPALLITFQLIVGVLTGFLGVMIATPLLATIMVLVQELWIKEVIEDGA